LLVDNDDILVDVIFIETLFFFGRLEIAPRTMKVVIKIN